ncbi:response regulator [Candidatus Reidiella endopervernicosa]|uniref:Response regulator n=1 Tax=Candidatus Reidiella endopervernicosa TaxID=2738883 RepID=A0A6N0HXW7_9GAMM|nr:response regulator [Candidatus Reidiella endopervernicosa]QKQ27204.1 response regulator [Candidatus Reidiella endopervernicosa]
MDEEQTLTILLVEDEKPNRSAVKRLLRRQGYRFQEADNGRRGLEVVDSESIDLILLDIGMPIMDGYEFLEKFRSDEKTYLYPCA